MGHQNILTLVDYFESMKRRMVSPNSSISKYIATVFGGLPLKRFNGGLLAGCH